MKKELDDALCLDFPLLFRDRRGDKMKTCMVWGFCCGDYWEPFVRRIAEKLEPMIQKQIDGGTPLVDCLVASQVKSKFYSFRFYTDNFTEESFQIIQDISAEADKICDECGVIRDDKHSKHHRAWDKLQ